MKEDYVTPRKLMQEHASSKQAPADATRQDKHIQRAEEMAQGILMFDLDKQNQILKHMYEVIETTRNIKIGMLEKEIDELRKLNETL